MCFAVGIFECCNYNLHFYVRVWNFVEILSKYTDRTDIRIKFQLYLHYCNDFFDTAEQNMEFI
jgi:hypothetical protein